MKNKKIIHIIPLIISMMLFSSIFITSCKEDEEIYLTLNSTNKEIELGDSFQFKADISTLGDADATALSVTWSIDNPSVATVSENGLVKTLEYGDATLKATLSNGEYALANISVAKTKSMIFTTDDYYFNPKAVDDTLFVNIMTDQLDSKNPLVWNSLDPSIVAILEDSVLVKDGSDVAYALVRPLSEGETRITLTNGDKRSYCTIHVGSTISLGWNLNMTNSIESRRLYMGEPNTLIAYTQVLPDNENNYWQDTNLYTWSVEDKDPQNPAVKISEFNQTKKGQVSWKVDPLKVGTTKLYLEARGKKITMIYKVADKDKVEIKSIVLHHNGKALKEGEEIVAPANNIVILEVFTEPLSAAATWPVSWTSSDEAIATIDKEGIVRTKKSGTVTITATSKDKTVTCRIKVEISVESISININSRNFLMIGDSEQWTANITPVEAIGAKCTWASDNESVATVDNNGVVRAIAAGKAKIKATAEGISSEAREITVVPTQENVDYSLVTADYGLWNFNERRLAVLVEIDGSTIEFNATTNNNALTDGVYTIGQNLENATVRWTAAAVNAYVTSGTLQVTDVNGDKKFAFNMQIQLEGKTITLTGTTDALMHE